MHDLRNEKHLERLGAIARDGVVQASMETLAKVLGLKTRRGAQLLVGRLVEAGSLERVDARQGGNSAVTTLRLKCEPKCERRDEHKCEPSANQVRTEGGRGEADGLCETNASVCCSSSQVSNDKQQTNELTNQETAGEKCEPSANARPFAPANGSANGITVRLDVSEALMALLRALLQGVSLPETVVHRDVKPANAIAANPANTRAPIQPMPPEGSDEGKSVAVARQLALEAGRSEQEAEAFVLEVLRKDHGRARRALHAILEMKAKGKAPRDAVAYFWGLYNKNAGVEGGNWEAFEASAVERPAAIARKKTPPIAGTAAWSDDDTKAWAAMSGEEKEAWKAARAAWKQKNGVSA